MKQFTAPWGTSWLQGRILIPTLRSHARSTSGIVLDVGCGRSPFRPLFDQASGYLRMDRSAIDPEVVLIDDPCHIPLPNASVDLILLFRMMGDIPDQSAMLTDLNRVLKPSGKILVYESMCFPQHDLPHDYWRVLPRGLEWMAPRVGLRVTEVVFTGGYFTQLAMHWNIYLMGAVERIPMFKPVVHVSRLLCNLLCLGLDQLIPRPILATDYFACLEKADPQPADK